MKRFFKRYGKAVGLCALFCAVFAAAFYLYKLPMSAVAYPAIVCAVIGLAACLRDFQKTTALHRRLSRVLSAADVTPETLPEPNSTTEEDYRRIALLLKEEHRALSDGMNAYCSDLSDYYTAWAHQIKTPIASMRLQLQNEDSPLARRLNGDLLRIEQYADMALLYLKLDSRSTDYVLQSHELDDIVKSAVRRFSGEFISRRLKLDYRPFSLAVITDEKWLGFVVEQILSNALKYTREGGITIFLRDGTLCVRDTGIGIAAEDLPRVFDKGFTGLNGRSDRRASGIGLYLCREICKKLGHGLSVVSEEGRGTEVRISFSQQKLMIE